MHTFRFDSQALTKFLILSVPAPGPVYVDVYTFHFNNKALILARALTIVTPCIFYISIDKQVF